MENIKAWRYIDYSKFVYMLEEKSLYFPNAVSLNDPFEGSVPVKNYQQRIKYFEEQFYSEEPFKDSFEQTFKLGMNENDAVSVAKVQVGYKKELREKLLRENKPEKALEYWIYEHNSESVMNYWNRQTAFISCWYGSKHESAAMWRIYSDSNNSVCIQTDTNTLRECLPSNIRIEEVKYIDFESESIPNLDNNPRDSLLLYLYKRISFEHENEIRAIYSSWKHLPKENTMRYGEALPKRGESQLLDLNQLIHNVYVSPTSEDWFKQLIEKTVTRYGLHANVHRSSLVDEPLY